MSDLRSEVVTTAHTLEAIREPWDALAVACARPLSAPDWLLAWWHTLAPRGALMRVVVVRDGAEVVGIAPFYAHRRRGVVEYHPLGSGMANRNQPLAVPGRERDVAAAIARALHACRPRPGVVCLDQIDLTSPWVATLAAAWPGRRPAVERRHTAPAPVLELGDGTFEEWRASKSSNFRQRLGRDGRRLEARGARAHSIATVPEFERVMDAFASLHGARWGDDSSLTSAPGHDLMLQAGRAMIEAGRFRAYVIETDEQVVTVQLFVAAGGEVAYWNGGWDPEWAALSPAIQGIVAGIRDAYERGDRRIDFGQGDHHYKRRLANDDAPVSWPRLYPRGRTYPLARGLAMAPRLREYAAEGLAHLPPGVRRRIDNLRGRAPA